LFLDIGICWWHKKKRERESEREEKKKKNWKCVKTSQSEELSSPSCATIIICLSSDVMSSIMALETNKFHE
jgi:hypothetical protein